MASSSSPRMSSDSATGFIWPEILAKPIPPHVVKFVHEYDINSIGKMLSAPDGRPFKEKREAIWKNLESFKKPKGRQESLLDIDEYSEEDEDEDEDEEEEEDDDDEWMGDEKKRASDVELQVPTGEVNESARSQDCQKVSSAQGQGEEIKLRLQKQMNYPFSR